MRAIDFSHDFIPKNDLFRKKIFFREVVAKWTPPFKPKVKPKLKLKAKPKPRLKPNPKVKPKPRPKTLEDIFP